MTWRTHLRKLTRKQLAQLLEHSRVTSLALLKINHGLLDKIGKETPPVAAEKILALMGQWSATVDELVKGSDEEAKKIIGNENIEYLKLN